MKSVAILCIILSVSIFEAKAQDLSSDVSKLSQLNQNNIPKIKYSLATNSSNEMQLLLGGLFLFYKYNISSQDASKCNFHVSCSEYALQAIKKQGVIRGGINFFDRFARCNNCSPYQYGIHPQSFRLLDEL